MRWAWACSSSEGAWAKRLSQKWEPEEQVEDGARREEDEMGMQIDTHEPRAPKVLPSTPGGGTYTT